MKYLIFTILIFILFSRPAKSQCPGREKISLLLDEISLKEDRKQIIADLNALIRLCKKCNYADDSTYAKSLHIYGRTLWKEDKIDSAIIMTQLSIRINTRKSPGTSYANTSRSYFNLGCIFNQTGQTISAISMFEKTIQISSKYPAQSQILTDSYIQLASIHYNNGDYAKSILYSEKGYSLAEKIDRQDFMANTLMIRSQALMAMNDDLQAEILLTKAINLMKDIEDGSLTGSIYSVLANLKGHLHKSHECIAYYKKAYQSYLNAGDSYGCGEAAYNLGDFYLQSLSDLKNALTYFQLALTHMDLPWTRAVIFSSIGELYTKKGEPQKGLKFSHQAMQSAFPNFRNTDLASNPPASDLRREQEKGILLPLIQIKADTWLKLADTKRQNKSELRNALSTYMLADTLVDYMRWEHSGAVSKLFWRNQTRSLYENAIDVCYRLNDTEKAFYFFEKSKAVLLNDQLNELAASRMLSPEDQKAESLLQKNVAKVQDQLSKQDSKDLRDKLFAALSAQEVFVKGLEKRNPAYYAYKYDSRVPDLTEFRTNELGKNQFFMSNFIGEHDVYTLMISGKSSRLRRVKTVDYQVAVAEFQKLVRDQEAQNQQFDQYLRSASKLYHLLIEPLGLPVGSRVIVSPDGDFLPYAALSKSASEPRYLVRDYTFSYAYSARSLSRMSRRTKTGLFEKTFLGVSPVNFGTNLGQASLPGSREALESIDTHFRNSRLLVGAEASRANFMKNAANYRIIQILTHAEAEGTDNTPELFFADSTLELQELSGIKNTRTELLVLSACETGLGKVQQGEGVYSLARGFAALGIPSAVTTLWSLENQSVYTLTEDFYNGLADQENLDIAIQKAQLRWLESSSKGKQLPYHWAGMVVVGNSDPLIANPTLTWFYVTTGLLLACILMVFGYYKIRNMRLPNPTDQFTLSRQEG